MFVWDESELNTEQSEAIKLPGNVFLIACPGSGKTRTLTYKAAYELSNLESPKKYVIAITYTHRAAEEIEERIESLGLDTSNLWIGTIHSFCLEWIIKPYSIYEPDLAFGYSVIDLHERERLLESLCEPHRKSGVSIYDCEYYFKEDGYVLGCQNVGKHPIVHSILEKYFQALNANKQIDFELMLWYASKLLTKNPILATLISNLFSIVLIDEYQDTKQLQYCILANILKAGAGSTRVFVVGDPNQAIYGSLGGYPISIEEFRSMTGLTIHRAELKDNYRSSKRIIEYFSHYNVYKTLISPKSKDSDYPSLITYARLTPRKDLVVELVRLIKHNVETLNIAPNEICILAPQWIHLATMTRSLVSELPEYEFDGPGMVPFARDMDNFWYKLSRIVLTEPSPSMFIRRMRWAGEVINELLQMGINLESLDRKQLLKLCNTIDLTESNGLRYLEIFFTRLIENWEISLDSFPQLKAHYIAFFESSRARIDRLEKEGSDISDIVFFRKVFQSRTGITVSTIHGVKGAEYDVVIAYALLEGMVPHFSDSNPQESAKKMLYVLSSRARKNLHLISETDRPRGKYGAYAATSILTDCKFNYDTL